MKIKQIKLIKIKVKVKIKITISIAIAIDCTHSFIRMCNTKPVGSSNTRKEIISQLN